MITYLVLAVIGCPAVTLGQELPELAPLVVPLPPEAVVKVSLPKQAPYRIVMHSRDDCSPCKRWKQNEMPQLLPPKSFWVVEIVNDPSGTVPWYEICTPEKCIRHTGYLSVEALKRLTPSAPWPRVQRAVPEQVVAGWTRSVAYSRPLVIDGSWTYYSPDGYTSRFQYPGDIRVHLNRTHGFVWAGQTKEELEMLHDSLHGSEPRYQRRGVGLLAWRR